MFKTLVRPQWALAKDDKPPESLTEVLALCAAIDEYQNLAQACRRLGKSYRHGWGVLREAKRAFGMPIVMMQRGRGAELTELGRKLLWADKRISARLTPLLHTLESELDAELAHTFSVAPQVLRIHASHGFAVAALRDFLIERKFPVDLKYIGSQEALASLSRNECDLAGFHVPTGKLESAGLGFYESWLKDATLRIVHLATRQQGLMVMRGNPKRLLALPDLKRPGIRFVNRQPGSGTRMLLDVLLRQNNLNEKEIVGYENNEYTHAAIAAYIASGMADVGFGVETAARQFKLDFIPIATERYFLATRKWALNNVPVKTVIDILNTKEFKHIVNQLPGYNAESCGSVCTVADTFSSLKKRAKISKKKS
jgi:molybdate transport repressor ModE-like protein